MMTRATDKGPRMGRQEARELLRPGWVRRRRVASRLRPQTFPGICRSRSWRTAGPPKEWAQRYDYLSATITTKYYSGNKNKEIKITKESQVK
jgi:hypothetical protein